MRSCFVCVCASALFACGAAQAPPSEEAPEATRITLALRLTPEAEHADAPAWRVRVVVLDDGGERRELDGGRYVGICTHGNPEGNALASVRCWWQGQEHMLSLERTAEGVELHGAHETLRIQLPNEATIRVLD